MPSNNRRPSHLPTIGFRREPDAKGQGASPVFYDMMRSNRFLLWLTLGGLALTGCAGTSPAPTAQPGAAATDPWQTLTRGMTADQVRAILGKPREVRPMQTQGGEIWVYERTAGTDVDLVATRTEDQPYIDPISGQQRTVSSPVYSRELRTVTQELNLLIYEGKLVSWKASLRRERRFDG